MFSPIGENQPTQTIYISQGWTFEIWGLPIKSSKMLSTDDFDTEEWNPYQ